MDRPLIFYSIAFFIGGLIAYSIKISNYLLGAFFIAPFFIFILNNKYKEILVLFFFILLSIFNFYMYFKIPQETIYEDYIRIEGKYGFKTLVTYNGKRYIINENESNQSYMKLININGTIKGNPIYEQGIVGEISISKINYKKEDFYYKIKGIKENFNNKLRAYISEDKVALINALCFGDSSLLEKEQKETFSYFGISHILSLSGFHIALIYKIMEGIFNYKISLIAIVLYTLFTGAGASAVRALIMILVLKLSKRFNKRYDSLSSLCFSAFIIVLIRPYIIFNIGFHLSYLATLGIILYSGKVKRKLYKLPSFIGEPLSLTFSAQIFSLPYCILYFKTINLNFILCNLAMIPVFTLILILGNLVFLFQLIDIMFLFLIRLLIIGFYALEGSFIIFKKIGFSNSYMSYLDGLICLTILFVFYLYKTGYKKLKYFPLTLLLLSLLQGYRFIPTIEYFKHKNNVMLQVNYKAKSLLISNKNINDKNIMDITRSKDLRILGEEPLKLSFKKNSYIILDKKGNGINMYFTSKKDNKIFLAGGNFIAYDLISDEKSDIINLEIPEAYVFNVEQVGKFYLIFNKFVYVPAERLN